MMIITLWTVKTISKWTACSCRGYWKRPLNSMSDSSSSLVICSCWTSLLALRVCCTGIATANSEVRGPVRNRGCPRRQVSCDCCRRLLSWTKVVWNMKRAHELKVNESRHVPRIPTWVSYGRDLRALLDSCRRVSSGECCPRLWCAGRTACRSPLRE